MTKKKRTWIRNTVAVISCAAESKDADVETTRDISKIDPGPGEIRDGLGAEFL